MSWAKCALHLVSRTNDTCASFRLAQRDVELNKLLDHDIKTLSGGELQRFAIAVVCVQECDVYMFDEPSSYLDVEQRLAAGRAIRGLLTHENFVIVVEHDLAVLDYLSDFICCLYGKPGAYGVVTMPFGVSAPPRRSTVFVLANTSGVGA